MAWGKSTESKKWDETKNWIKFFCAIYLIVKAIMLSFFRRATVGVETTEDGCERISKKRKLYHHIYHHPLFSAPLNSTQTERDEEGKYFLNIANQCLRRRRDVKEASSSASTPLECQEYMLLFTFFHYLPAWLPTLATAVQWNNPDIFPAITRSCTMKKSLSSPTKKKRVGFWRNSEETCEIFMGLSQELSSYHTFSLQTQNGTDFPRNNSSRGIA